MKLNTKYLIYALFGVCVVLLIVLAAMLLWLWQYEGVNPVVQLELGNTLPDAEIFLENGGSASYIDPPEISLTEEGDYTLTLQLFGTTRDVTLEVRDTRAPIAVTKDTVISQTETLEPKDVLRGVLEPSGYRASWTETPSFGTPGIYETAVRLEDTLGHVSETPVTVTIVELTESLTREAGSSAPQAVDFIRSPSDSPVITGGLDDTTMSSPGSHDVTVSCCGTDFHVVLNIVDTVFPTAEPCPQETYSGYPVEAAAFVKNIVDASDVTVTFVKEPDWNTDVGDVLVKVQVEDGGGNSVFVETVCTIRHESTPPVLYGVNNRTCYIGDAVIYLKGVFAADNIDASGDIEIEVDKSQVDARTPGQYNVTYTATDRSGNVGSKTVVFTFMNAKVSESEVNAMIDDVLAEIWTDDMDPVEKARAVYDYVYDHVNYVDSDEHSDWLLAAYNGLTNGTGDCFTYQMLSYLMLSRIDECEVLFIERPDGYATHHFWCLVSFGTGWYHFDTTNYRTGRFYPKCCFMKTTEELYSMSGGSYNWNYEADLYPAVATEPFTDPFK